MTYTLFFYSRLSVSKSIFYVSLGNNFFTVFCGGPLVVEAPGPVCPHLESGPVEMMDKVARNSGSWNLTDWKMTEDKVVTEFRALSFSSPSVFLTVYYQVRVLHFQRSPSSALGVLDDHALYKSAHAARSQY